ncbi:ABC transporter permease [Kyrpidia spormannii]|uniref:ABC transporter permease n=1 Tax=Kyrpidia spormannii TaxID=2055160 RepID=A0A6F9E4U7_9BACL|nr:ABC transporter permease [Kyrpidia spormannii]CAB3391533.1 ABC transporter permease [Kyrpidia spormannii]
MSAVWIIAKREMKLGYRNPWAYSFLALFSVFSLALVLIQSNRAAGLPAYTHATATMMNLILYLLPMMTLLLGAFSVTAEKEDGTRDLLSTYTLSSWAYMAGKFVGLVAVLASILAVGFGLFGLVGAWLGQGVTLADLALFLGFSAAILLLYLGIALLIGALAANRWQALTMGVGVWFVTVLAWPTLLIASLNLMPHSAVKPMLTFLTFCNPAELVRLFTVIQLGAGSILGPAYVQLVEGASGPWGPVVMAGFGLLWLAVFQTLAVWVWERGRRRG